MAAVSVRKGKKGSNGWLVLEIVGEAGQLAEGLGPKEICAAVEMHAADIMIPKMFRRRPPNLKVCHSVESFIDHIKAAHIAPHVNDEHIKMELSTSKACVCQTQDTSVTLVRVDVCQGGEDEEDVKRVASDVWIPNTVRSAIDNGIQSWQLNEDVPPTDVLLASNWAITRSFVYLDVSDFSNYKPLAQCLIVNALTELSNPQKWSKEEATLFGEIEMISIGDGYIYVFDHVGSAVLYACGLATRIDEAAGEHNVPEFHFRIGIDTGPVHHFWDRDRGRWNYVGNGINGGRRILEATGTDYDDLVFISSAVRKEIQKDKEVWPIYSQALLNRGRKRDKHLKMRRVYEVNHSFAYNEIAEDLLPRWYERAMKSDVE